jgi:hypothetical protein
MIGIGGRAIPALADDVRSNADPGAPLSLTDPTLQLKLSGDLVRYGRREADPVALILAARLLKDISVEDKTRDKKSQGGAESDKAEAGMLTVEDILEEARSLAGDQSVLQAMIDDVAATDPKGRIEGPVRHIDRVQALAIDVYEDVVFAEHEEAAIYLEGDGDTDLDLLVIDELGIEICRDTGYSDRALCRWTPRWTGPFRIEIHNLGNVWNQYQLFTN